MTNRITKYKKQLESIKEKIKNDLEIYFKDFDYTKDSKEIQIHKISNNQDLNNIYSNPGFYIILTNHIFEENKCNFKYKDQTAVYRGHCYSTKQRVKSHLSNKDYNANLKDYHVQYKVCMKVDEKVNGINIEDERFENWNWTVIVHKMRNSNKIIREQAELAFDEIYNKPYLSRE